VLAPARMRGPRNENKRSERALISHRMKSNVESVFTRRNLDGLLILAYKITYICQITIKLLWKRNPRSNKVQYEFTID